MLPLEFLELFSCVLLVKYLPDLQVFSPVLSVVAVTPMHWCVARIAGTSKLYRTSQRHINLSKPAEIMCQLLE